MAYDVTDPVPIPADVEMPDKVLAGLTARQVAIAATAAAVLWLGWMAARHVMPLPAFAALAAPVAAGGHRAGDRASGTACPWTGCWPPRGGRPAPRAAWSPPPRASPARPPGPRPARPAGPAAGAAAAAVAGRLARRGDQPRRARRRHGRRGVAP